MNLNKTLIYMLFAYSIMTPLCLLAEETITKTSELEKSAEAKSDAGDYSGAVKDYNKAIKVDPKNTNLFYFRGLAKVFLKDYDGAIKDASKSIELDPKNAASLYLRGTAKSQKGKDKEAIKDYTEGLKLSPSEQSLQLNFYSGRAGSKSALKDYYGAVSDYDEAIKLKPEKALSYFLRGVAKLHLGEKEAALKDLSKAGDLGYSNAYDIIKQIRENKL